jgi:hypothetical protein
MNRPTSLGPSADSLLWPITTAVATMIGGTMAAFLLLLQPAVA